VTDGLHARNQTAFQSALDNVRNLVGSPLAGIDDQEMVDTRHLCTVLSDLISLDPVTGAFLFIGPACFFFPRGPLIDARGPFLLSVGTRGNPKWGNLPRKFNIAVSGSRDDFAHTHINDIGLEPCAHGETGEMGFNVVLGGYMSIKRVAHSVEGDMWVPAQVQPVVDVSEAILRIFRDGVNFK